MDDQPYAVIVAQHAEDGAFLWRQRDLAVERPQYSITELLDLDDRVDAHLDGLRLADDGWDIALDQLDIAPEAGAVFVCSFLAFLGGNQARIARVLQAADDPSHARAAASALGWLSDDREATEYLLQLGLSDEAIARRVGISASAIRRVSAGPVLQRGLTDKDAAVRARAARAVGELGALNYSAMLRPLATTTSDLASRFWSSWSLGLLSGDSSAVAELRTIALTEPRFRRRAVDMAARRGDPRATKAWLRGLEASPGGKRLVLQAFGALGDPDAVPRLLDAMTDPPVARVAGEAFAFITGVHISYDELKGQQPEGFDAGPTEDPADENVAMDADEHLYWPDRAKCEKWWSVHRGRFSGGTRYLCGKPMTPESLRKVLKTGYQRQRAAAALELAIREPGKPLYEVRAPGFRQL